MHFSFDFDYTLADSSNGAVECASYALRNIGLPPASPDEIRQTIGLSLEKTFYQLTNIDDNVALTEQFKRTFLERADVVMLEHIKFYAYTPRVLEKLKDSGHFTSIVSTKFSTRVSQSLERDGLHHLVDFVIGGDEVKQNKPHPEGLLVAIESSGIAKQQTVYLGDSESDGECAKRAEVPFIAVCTGKTSRDNLKKWSPKTILNDLTELQW